MNGLPKDQESHSTLMTSNKWKVSVGWWKQVCDGDEYHLSWKEPFVEGSFTSVGEIIVFLTPFTKSTKRLGKPRDDFRVLIRAPNEMNKEEADQLSAFLKVHQVIRGTHPLVNEFRFPIKDTSYSTKYAKVLEDRIDGGV